MRRGEPLEHVGAERRRRGDGDLHRSDDARPQDSERLLAVLVVGAVDDQHAVEVVELVLDDARASPSSSKPNRLAVRIDALERRRVTERSTGHTHALQREAALLVGLASRPPARRCAD